MGAAFLNYIRIGSSNNEFTINGDLKTLTSQVYTVLELRNAILTATQTTLATARIGIDASGFWTFDTTAGTIRYVWESNLMTLLGFTAQDTGAGLSTITAPRRMRGAFHCSPATIREHYPLPHYALARETVSLAGVTRSDTSATPYDETQFEIQFIDAAARYTSPSGALATTYANAASTETGLTAWHHARDCWYPASDVASQGWSDGRPVQFFEDASNAVISLSGSSAVDVPANHTQWVFTDKARESFQSQKERPPRNVHHRLVLPAREYIAPT